MDLHWLFMSLAVNCSLQCLVLIYQVQAYICTRLHKLDLASLKMDHFHYDCSNLEAFLSLSTVGNLILEDHDSNYCSLIVASLVIIE